ncbi:MAG: 2-succinyl-5-enolpyruvyl-6-hydroxy-3-cyclohexene-1-carboxylic-acid synthase [Anaerolineales bacterium]
MNPSNRNALWANLFVEELQKLGLQAVCIAPGSRSTPLAFAFARSGIKIYVHSDERSAGYFALGLAKASGVPVALLCTSGTAAANFFPAVVEANYGEVPLLVLTADRPAEMRESGANQTIDQTRLYGEHVRMFANINAPESDFSIVQMRALQTLAARAFEAAQAPIPGATHLNFEFRKPLEPTPQPNDLPAWWDEVTQAKVQAAAAHTTFSRPFLAPSSAQVNFLRNAIAPRGIIVAGPRCPAGDFPALLFALSQRLGYPILADSLSGLRFHPESNQNTLGGFNAYLRQAPPAQLILRFGDVPVSAALCDYLQKQSGATHVHISSVPRWRDDQFVTTHFLHADPALACRALLESANAACESAWLSEWQRMENLTWKALEALRAEPGFEGGILPDVVETLPAGGALYIANSLPIRHLDEFAAPQKKALRVFANRGASGIDGTLSSALGAAAHLPGLVFVSGDLTFYHDLNGLLALKRHPLQAVMVVINNNGGGIFERLPVSQFEPPFNNLFRAPHGLTFESAAAMYQISYARVERLRLKDALQEALKSKQPAILEIFSDAAEFERIRSAAFLNIRRTL